MKLTIKELEQFKADYIHKAMSYLDGMMRDVQCGEDGLGGIGGLISALSDIKKVNTEIEMSKEVEQ